MSNDQFTRIIVRASTSALAPDAWALITDWPAQSRWIPFTRVTLDSASGGVGARFTGRTRVGPIRFDDPMEVTQWQPPGKNERGYCRVQKFGPWILGTAEIEVIPGRAGSEPTTLVWKESVRLRGVSPVFSPLIRAFGGILFQAALRKAVREPETG